MVCYESLLSLSDHLSFRGVRSKEEDKDQNSNSRYPDDLLNIDNPYFEQNCKADLSYDVASGSEITPCNKICKPLVVYRFTGNVMTSITTLRT